MSSRTGFRVLLVGLRGAGKTTVGRLLARRLSVPFLDADEELERRCGRSAADLLREGELRDRERVLLTEVLGETRGVVAAGGGAVLWSGLRSAAEGWTTIWLDASTAVLQARLEADAADRPPLTDAETLAEEIDAVRARRATLYREASDLHLCTDGLQSEAVACRIEEWLRDDGSVGAS